eukprot:6256354-Prymnesium_polylepis.1
MPDERPFQNETLYSGDVKLWNVGWMNSTVVAVPQRVVAVKPLLLVLQVPIPPAVPRGLHAAVVAGQLSREAGGGDVAAVVRPEGTALAGDAQPADDA